jgi:hypothetical protein
MTRRELLKNSALLLGYAVTTGALTETFIACNSQDSTGGKPLFFSQKQLDLVAEITETILPKTNTPGAKDIGVPMFIDKMVHDLLSEEEQDDFVAGLKKLDTDCKTAHQKSFVECGSEQRAAFLLELDRQSAKLPPSVWGITLAKPSPMAFYRRLKNLTLLGYYTSQEIGEKVFAYDPIPGVFIGCYPMSEVKNAWNEG